MHYVKLPAQPYNLVTTQKEQNHSTGTLSLDPNIHLDLTKMRRAVVSDDQR